ncbi:hypothetical protein L1285_17380 [Pseudoalteromonas sp. DL2-H2.2]|uniref:hypothetical protein n=1 Tax=Pseudoalteromonas sp. DL2-H2.2 TaxID=2908889 RepID=UPI001F21E76B|nr:hypothetical protein [Pseudoalteromonas sp. DL2-H2.2]MCF2910089.1 hypothetical protein [Pseudoalteromonas sp. DL2-H2.2]
MALEQDIANLVAASETLTSTVDNKIQSIDSALSAAISASQSKTDQHLAKVDTALSKYLDTQSHFRVSRNQALVPDNKGEFPAYWDSGNLKRATLLETVQTHQKADTRSELAREFLRAVNSDTQYFAGNFNIWELEYYPYREVTVDNQTRKTYAYLMYQYFRRPTHMTVAAVVKHIRGIVPTGSWCQGLRANEPAKICGGELAPDGRNKYSHCVPTAHGMTLDSSETLVIQVALPAVVTGKVQLDSGWGQFPHVGHKDLSAYDYHPTTMFP